MYWSVINSEIKDCVSINRAVHYLYNSHVQHKENCISNRAAIINWSTEKVISNYFEKQIIFSVIFQKYN